MNTIVYKLIDSCGREELELSLSLSLSARIQYTCVCKMKFVTVVLSLVIFVALTSNVSAGSNETSSFELFFDAIIKGVIKAKGNLIDPMPIEDKNTTLPSKTLPVPMPVKVNLLFSNNKLWGMKKLHRSGSAVQTRNSNNDKVTRVQLNISPLLLTSDLNATTKLLSIRLPQNLIRINATIDSFDFIVEIVANKTRKEITVNTFVIDDLKNLTVHYYRESRIIGREYLDYLLTQCTKVVTILFKKQIIQIIEETTKNIMQEKIDALPESIKKLLYG